MGSAALTHPTLAGCCCRERGADFGALRLLFICPLLFESRSNECSALEARLITLGATISGQFMVAATLQGLSNGALAKAELAEKFPSIPTPVSCTCEYWILIFDLGASI